MRKSLKARTVAAVLVAFTLPTLLVGFAASALASSGHASSPHRLCYTVTVHDVNGTSHRPIIRGCSRSVLVVPGARQVSKDLAPLVHTPAATIPSWLHITQTPLITHKGFPCVIVGGGDQDTTALVCADGFASTS